MQYEDTIQFYEVYLQGKRRKQRKKVLSIFICNWESINDNQKQKTKPIVQKQMGTSSLKDNNNKNCLLLNLSKMLIMAKNKPYKFIFGTPVQFNKNGWTFFSSNPSTNFMIISYIEEKKGTGHFLIESFDVTVTYSLQVIQQKLKKALQLYKFVLQSQFEKVKANLSKEEKGQFLKQESSYQQIIKARIIFTHSIICPQKLAEKMNIIKNNNPDFNINFIPIESINVTCPDKELAINQQSVKDIVLQLLNKSQEPPNKQ